MTKKSKGVARIKEISDELINVTVIDKSETETKAQPKNAISEMEALQIRMTELKAEQKAAKEALKLQVQAAKAAQAEMKAAEKVLKEAAAKEIAEANVIAFEESKRQLTGKVSNLLYELEESSELNKGLFSEWFGTLRNIATEVNKTLPAKVGMGETLQERYERVYKEYAAAGFSVVEMSDTSQQIINNIISRAASFEETETPKAAEVEANRLVNSFV